MYNDYQIVKENEYIILWEVVVMKRKVLPVLLVIVLFFSPIVLAEKPGSEEMSMKLYNKEGAVIESIGLPLAPENYPDNKTVPMIERAMNAVVVDGKGKVTDRVRTDKTSPQGSVDTMSIGARVATIAVAADEEYRAADPNWVSTTGALVEEMDDAFNRDHSFDLDIKLYIGWESDGSDNSAILGDLRDDWASDYDYDFLIGFTKDTNFDAGGIAYKYTSEPSTMATSVVLDQSSYSAIWHAGQHELSHNLGLGHDTEIQNNKSWYGTSY